MNNFNVLRYTPDYKLQWNKFVAEANNATFLFNRNFMDYHADRFLDFSLLIFDEDKLIALFPANVVNNEVFSHQGLTYGGLLTGLNIYTNSIFEIFKKILNFYEQHSIASILIKEIPPFFSKQGAQDLNYLAFICEANLIRRDIHSVIDYNSEYRISKSVHRDVKQNMKKYAIKIQESNEFEGFWNQLLTPHLSETHQAKPVHSLNEILLLKEKFPNNIKLITCLLNDELIGGVVIFETSTTVHCQYISGSKKFNSMGLLTNLLFEIIERFKTEKKFFNFGISHINGGKNINLGLLTWKEKFGARSVTQNFYVFKTSSANLIDSVFV